MLTYNERIELREKLINGEISLELAKEQYWKDYKEGQRSWHTKDWKERRAKFLKEKCEICDSTVTLTIQHLSHSFGASFITCAYNKRTFPASK
jgi:hypothetical protein